MTPGIVIEWVFAVTLVSVAGLAILTVIALGIALFTRSKPINKESMHDSQEDDSQQRY